MHRLMKLMRAISVNFSFGLQIKYLNYWDTTNLKSCRLLFLKDLKKLIIGKVTTSGVMEAGWLINNMFQVVKIDVTVDILKT